MMVYVTLLATDDFLPGTLTLWQSLQDVKSGHPLVVVITEKISKNSRNELTNRGIVYHEFPVLSYANETVDFMTSTLWSGHLKNTANKLNIFRLIEYEKIVYLDSDMLVMRNIDWLFDKPHGSAVQDIGQIYDRYDVTFGFKMAREYYHNFNSGLLVINPSVEEYGKVMTLLKEIQGYDQEIIRELWGDWATNEEKQLPLNTSIMVNFLPLYLFEDIVNFTDIYVLHFTSEKPFHRRNIDLTLTTGLCEKIYLEVMHRAMGIMSKNNNHTRNIPSTGVSYGFFKKLIQSYIKNTLPKNSTALDVGCGRGVYGELLSDHLIMDGLDVYSPHDNEYSRSLYDKVIIADILGYQYDYYDLVIFGDILEHLEIYDAQYALAYAMGHSSMVLVAVPYQLKQGQNENPAEEHLQDDLTPALMIERYPELQLFANNELYGYYIWKKPMDD